VSDSIAPKRYDRAYFRRWYHDPRTRISSVRALERKVHLAVSVAEYFLGRRLRTVVDIGCGEALWYDALKQLRPRVQYTGIDSSEYVVRAFGDSHHVRHGSFGALRALRLPTRVDLIVCADVLQYIPARDLIPGLRAIRRALGGVAYIEVFTRDDDMEGDMQGWHARSANEYRRLFRNVGLSHCGVNCFVDVRKSGGVNEFDLMLP